MDPDPPDSDTQHLLPARPGGANTDAVPNYESIESQEPAIVNDSDDGDDSPPFFPQLYRQYLAAISATLIALAAGVSLAWTAPIRSVLQNGGFNGIAINDDEMGWIASLVNFGAVIGCLPAGILCDKFGRKPVLLFLTCPFVFGWLLIIGAHHVWMLYLGRLLTGLATGPVCIAAPMYLSEIAHKSVRGELTSYFQIMVTMGVLYAYVAGAVFTPLVYTVYCMVPICVFALAFVCQEESPVYYWRRGRIARGCYAFLWLNGGRAGPAARADEMASAMIPHLDTSWHALTSQRRNRRALCIATMLMFFQQFSGINAIIFFTSDIFRDAGSTLDPNYSSIIVGVFQVVATFASSLIVDRLGRRKLLIVSTLLMSLSLFSLGVCILAKKQVSSASESVVSYLSIVLLVVYIVAFSLGLGPVPWVICGEIFQHQVKGVAISLAGASNWVFSFVITRFYLQLDRATSEESLFFCFATLLIVAALFTYYIVPETRGRTNEEIQAELVSAESDSDEDSE